MGSAEPLPFFSTMKQLIHRISRYCQNQPGSVGLLGAALFEAITCLFRFGFGLESTRDTAALAQLTMNIRLHHGYFGLLCLLLLVVQKNNNKTRPWLIIAGITFFLSDLVHHGLILPVFTGSTGFDFFYH